MLWWQAGDDVTWSTPWTVISMNSDTGEVLGGAKAGEGQVIGRFLVQNEQYLIELKVPYAVNKKDQQLNFTEVVTAPAAAADCNFAIKAIGQCELYNGIYAVLAGIDYRAFGEVAPGVASDVMSVSTVVKLVKSAWFFKPRVDTIRDEYLVLLIKSIAQLKALKTADQKNRAAYLQQARQTYSNLIITAVDSILKTQKMAPEALGSLSGTAIGSVLAYLNLNSAADYAIALGNPPWFRELVSPIIREIGQLSLDLVLNGSGTPLQARIDRFLAMEAKLKETVRRICASSPTSAQSECAAAWNQ